MNVTITKAYLIKVKNALTVREESFTALAEELILQCDQEYSRINSMHIPWWNIKMRNRLEKCNKFIKRQRVILEHLINDFADEIKTLTYIATHQDINEISIDIDKLYQYGMILLDYSDNHKEIKQKLKECLEFRITDDLETEWRYT